ncbi:MAG: hypothetical protein HDS24_03815 [Bacteroides sp.]|nr:hypothetical protein [Bacteroides sp.]
MEEQIPLNEKAIGVVITNTKANGNLTYDAVRRAWPLSSRQLEMANASRYVLAIEHGTVVDIFERHGDFREDKSEGDPKRYAFIPVPVIDINVRKRYIGCHYRSYGASVIFFGFDNEKNESNI